MVSHTVYAVASGKGGVGKTATTVNLGASLAAAGYTVAIVDTDLGMANLGGFAGLGDEGPTLHEVLAGEVALEEAVYESFNGLAVVPSGISLNGFASVETEAIADAVNALRDAFDYVILDLGAGLSHDTVLPLALADAVVLVSTPQPLSIQDTAKTREVTQHLGGQVAGVVLTRAAHPQELDLDEIREDLGLPVLAVIPESEAVPASARTGEALLEHAPDDPATEGYRGLARIVEEESLESAPVVPEVPKPEPEPVPTDQQSPDQQPPGQQSPEQGQVGEQSPDQQPHGQVSGTHRTERLESDQPGGARAPTGASPPAQDPAHGSPRVEPSATQPSAGGQDSAGTGGETSPEETGPATPDSGPMDSGSVDSGPGTSDDPPVEDSTERTAAEIAAAIEEAAADETAPTPASGTFDSASTEPETEPGAPADETEPGAPADETATETETPGEPGADSDADEPEAFQVEAGGPGSTEQEQAVDELFSIEDDDPGTEDDDEDDESNGLLGRFFG